MQHRRKSVKLIDISGGTEVVPPEKRRFSFGTAFSTVVETCTCAGDMYGHERHCGEVEPVPGCAVPNWNHTSTDSDDLEV